MSELSAPAPLPNPATDFPRLYRLSAELRVRIWFFTLPDPRIVPVGHIYVSTFRHRLTQFDGPKSYRGLPTALFICRESRFEALRHYCVWNIHENKDLIYNPSGGLDVGGNPRYCHPGVFDFSRDSVFISARPYLDPGQVGAERTLPGIRLPQTLPQPVRPMTLYLSYPDIRRRFEGPDSGRKQRLKPFSDLIFRLQAVHEIVLVLHNPYGRLYDGGPDDANDDRFHLPLKMVDIRITDGVDGLIEDPELFRGLKEDDNNPAGPDDSWPDTYDSTVIKKFERHLGRLAQSDPLLVRPSVHFGVEVNQFYNPVDGPALSGLVVYGPELPEWVWPPLNVLDSS